MPLTRNMVAYVTLGVRTLTLHTKFMVACRAKWLKGDRDLRQLRCRPYRAAGRQAHGDHGANADLAVQIEVATMLFN